MVGSFYMDGNHTLWVATEGGLSRIKDGRVLTLTSQNGLPCNMVHWMLEDDAHFVWLYLACGVVRIPRSELDAWVSDPKRKIGTTLFDSSDGVRSLGSYAGSDPVVAKAADGRLWFRPFGGVSVIDPKHLYVNKLPPPVHIEQITVDDKSYDLKPGLRLPANVRNIRIEFTALSLVAPETIHFKYKLEGQNQNWHEVINERYATYTNLPPRNYRFRVMATNNSGVWNETGDTLEFSIAPAYYQTNWFRALITATVLALMWAAYQFRVRLIQRESRQLRDVIDTIPASAWSAGPDGSVEFINERWLEYAGFSREKSLGWGWETAIHPEDRDRFLSAWRAAIATGKPMEAEARVHRTDGQYRWLLIRNVPLCNKSGKVVKWYGTSTDIEDLKRAEEEREKLRQLEADLAHINRVSILGELSASVAHEVNQPLTGIVSNGGACLRWLTGDAPNLEEAREAVRDIVRDGKRAGEVIARIRALTKRAAPPKEKLDLNEVVREVLALVGDQAKKNNVMIRTQFADDLFPDLGVLADVVERQRIEHQPGGLQPLVVAANAELVEHRPMRIRR
jgi:PAS domain S-box-containing protein